MSENGRGLPLVAEEMICMRCVRFSEMRSVPKGNGNTFQEEQLATVYVDESTNKLVVIRHNQDCRTIDPSSTLGYHIVPATV